jgi:hypothetical protein
MADGIVARRLAEHLAAALPHPSRVATYEINIWGHMIADSSAPILQALRGSRRCMLLLTGAGGIGLLAATRRARPAGVSIN